MRDSPLHDKEHQARLYRALGGYIKAASRPRTEPPSRCGVLTHDNHDLAAHGAVRGLDWSGELTWTKGGTAIIEGEKPDLESNEGDST